MRTFITPALCFFLICHLVHSQEIDINTITVYGEYYQEVTPDEIELSIVFNDRENLKKGSDIQEKEARLKEILRSFNILEEDLSVDNFGASRAGYTYSNSAKVNFSKTYKLDIRKLDILNDLMIKLFEAGADDISIRNKETEYLKNIRDQSVVEALKNAKKKAENMADYLGRTLGEVIEIKEYEVLIDDINTDPLVKRQESSLWAFGAVTRSLDNSYRSDSFDFRKVRLEKKLRVIFKLK